MKNELFKALEKECPAAIKGEIVTMNGMIIPVVGSIGDNGKNDITPGFWECLDKIGVPRRMDKSV